MEKLKICKLVTKEGAGIVNGIQTVFIEDVDTIILIGDKEIEPKELLKPLGALFGYKIKCKNDCVVDDDFLELIEDCEDDIRVFIQSEEGGFTKIGKLAKMKYKEGVAKELYMALMEPNTNREKDEEASDDDDDIDLKACGFE
ncbi:hypothetical protein ACHJH3_10940 [Campylobacter sp. MOP7]|uniref:hypothetical protein n=1 Tax=Campylobacter canis TaxID=3378588 RepID=UPI00387EE462